MGHDGFASLQQGNAGCLTGAPPLEKDFRKRFGNPRAVFMKILRGGCIFMSVSARVKD